MAVVLLATPKKIHELCQNVTFSFASVDIINVQCAPIVISPGSVFIYEFVIHSCEFAISPFVVPLKQVQRKIFSYFYKNNTIFTMNQTTDDGRCQSNRSHVNNHVRRWRLVTVTGHDCFAGFQFQIRYFVRAQLFFSGIRVFFFFTARTM